MGVKESALTLVALHALVPSMLWLRNGALTIVTYTLCAVASRTLPPPYRLRRWAPNWHRLGCKKVRLHVIVQR